MLPKLLSHSLLVHAGWMWLHMSLWALQQVAGLVLGGGELCSHMQFWLPGHRQRRRQFLQPAGGCKDVSGKGRLLQA